MTTPRTAFAIGAKDITLDIKDHTITFANEAYHRVYNGIMWPRFGRKGFGWTIPSGSYVQSGCDYLQRECQVSKSALVIPEILPEQPLVVTSLARKRLKAGEYYALTFWDDRDNVTVEATIAGVEAKVLKRDKPGTSNYAIFMPEENVAGPIQFTFSSKDGENSGSIRIDNVKLNYSRCHGITGRGSAVHWNNPAPDLPVTTEYERNLKEFTLKGDKGRIVEGR